MHVFITITRTFGAGVWIFELHLHIIVGICATLKSGKKDRCKVKGNHVTAVTTTTSDYQHY